MASSQVGRRQWRDVQLLVSPIVRLAGFDFAPVERGQLSRLCLHHSIFGHVLDRLKKPRRQKKNGNKEKGAGGRQMEHRDLICKQDEYDAQSNERAAKTQDAKCQRYNERCVSWAGDQIFRFAENFSAAAELCLVAIC